MKIIFSVTALLISLNSFGQIVFEKGYIIHNNGEKTVCLIKNKDWKYNPREIEYKLNDSGLSKIAEINEIKEFGIDGFSRYVRAKTKIDRTPDNVDNIINGILNKNPIWSDETLFLKVLVHGKASLYLYEEAGMIRFFYSTNDTSINQLVYKTYKLSEQEIAENTKFRQQLWADVSCSLKEQNKLRTISYSQKALEKYFKNYNTCKGDTFTDFSTKPKREYLNIKIAPGINLAKFSSKGIVYTGNGNNEFKKEISFELGLEIEYVLSFNKNKWSLIFEPTFNQYKSEMEIPWGYTTVSDLLFVNYKAIEIPMGVRYYSFIDNNWKIFLNAFFVSNYKLNFNSTITYARKIYHINSVEYYEGKPFDINARMCFAFGAGIEYKRLSLEMRYYTKRDLLYDYFGVSTSYQRTSFILGYKLFKH